MDKEKEGTNEEENKGRIRQEEGVKDVGTDMRKDRKQMNI